MLKLKSLLCGSNLKTGKCREKHAGRKASGQLSKKGTGTVWTSASRGEGRGTPLQDSCLENPIGCSPWGRQKSDTTARLHFHFFTFMHWRRKWQPTPVFLPGESQGRGSLVGCHFWGRTESDTTEAI